MKTNLVYSVKNKSISDYYEPMLIMGETVAEIEDTIRRLPDLVGWSIEKDTLVIRDITEEYYEKERVNEARKAIRRKLESEYNEHLKKAFYLRDELDFYDDHREYLNYEELHEAYVKYKLERMCNGDEVRYNPKTKHYEWYTKEKEVK